MKFEDVLEQLKRPDVSIERLLDECWAPGSELWKEHPELYVEFVDRLIQFGHPTRALDLALEGRQQLEDNSRLQYQLALAANRGGNSRYAEELLQPLLDKVLGVEPPRDVDTALHVDIIALKGSVLKSRARTPEEALAAAEWYDRATAVPGAKDLPDGGTFPLINAATMWRGAGDLAQSNARAVEVIRRIESLAAAATEAGNPWLAATLGEANLLLGEHEQAAKWYGSAIAVAIRDNKIGVLIAIRKQLQLLRKWGATADPHFIDQHLGTVVVFSGHMVDSPERHKAKLSERFPNGPNLINAAAAAIRAKLTELNARVGYCSLACGGDILFAEAMLERHAELHVVLPFAQRDFLRTSVDFGHEAKHWRVWRKRFDDILEKLETAPGATLRYATSEPYLGSDELYKFGTKVLQGLAVLRSRECASNPVAVALFDKATSDPNTGTAAFLATWSAAGYQAASHVIDLGELRRAHPTPPATKDKVAPPVMFGELTRPVKAMLFADVAGFSKIEEWQQFKFRTTYAKYLSKLFKSRFGKTAIYANTWGDALHVVFNSVADAARFACELLEPTPTVAIPPEWHKFDLGNITPFRVGLHTGPVFELEDIFQGRSEFAGQHVNRTARIEPVTLRGCAYASEQFAAQLMMEAGQEFLIEGVGQLSLAKNYDRCALYRVQLATP